jgi:hypothetical protein
MNKPGMQSDIVAPDELQEKWRREWQDLAAVCRDHVERWSAEGMHKQHANRPLEWFGWIDVQVTSTQWQNFFALRISEYAQPEFNELALAMHKELAVSEPKLLHPGEWHLPWVMPDERETLEIDRQLRLSVARSARLSYKPFDGNADWESELARYEKLVVSSPVHASPAEHQATPDSWIEHSGEDQFPDWAQPDLHGNFHGWVQYRKMLPNEAVSD